MTDIDVSKIKGGDVVGVRVFSLNNGARYGQEGVFIGVDAENGYWVEASAIVSHTPAPHPALKVGDRVRLPPAAGRERTVIWIAENRVWLAPLPSMDSAPVFDISDTAQWERV